MKFEYDIIVVGGGHAGCEAATAAANLGSKTLLISMDMTKFAQMSCNPAIGGVAKGQIVREIDALGGQMGIISDKTTIQFRMLNLSKGPAMWSPRAQCDKSKFSAHWRKTLENTRNLYLWQDTVNELIVDNNEDKQSVVGVRTMLGIEFSAKKVILTNGTFLNGLIHVGKQTTQGGRAGDSASYGITELLINMGFESGRMKTGTPVRIDARTLNFDQFEIQDGDKRPQKFSYSNETEPVKYQLPCFVALTTPEVHNILRSGFKDSPLFDGTISGIGVRYCPSIEDKLHTFSDKESHNLYLEPEGRDTNEYYLNGFSSSLPLNIQIDALKKVKGFENVHIFSPGYAIEYDYFPPTQLYHTMETKLVDNLYFAGQINGTTGYEEAAAQGMMAGINAHNKIIGEKEFVLGRDQAYIGVLIDDLVTKGVDEPYRMFTSRAEYRILLRQDNADLRLTPIGRELGLIGEKRWDEFMNKRENIELLKKFLRKEGVTPEELKVYFERINTPNIPHQRKISEILTRNEVKLGELSQHIDSLNDFIIENNISNEVIEEVEIQIKYQGYIERERNIADKLTRLENINIRPDFNYNSLNSLTIEARQKLTEIKPATIGQASRIPGVSPADINVLLIHLGR